MLLNNFNEANKICISEIDGTEKGIQNPQNKKVYEIHRKDFYQTTLCSFIFVRRIFVCCVLYFVCYKKFEWKYALVVIDLKIYFTKRWSHILQKFDQLTYEICYTIPRKINYD